MRHADIPSWMVQHGTSLPADIALYVRDALALSVSTEPDIPLLVPSVPVSVPAGVDRAAVARQWPGWWDDVLTSEAVGHYAGPIRPEVDAAVSAFEQRIGRHFAAARPDPRRIDVGGLVAEREAELGRPARRFRLVITELTVDGPLCHRRTPEHLVVSTASPVDDVLRRIIAELA
jgi:hypothetical protein